MNSTQIRIILVDDHKMVRESWKMLLENNSRIKVIADCENGFQAIEHAQTHSPDIMLVDINMTPLNGFNITEKIREKCPGVKIIGFSVSNKPRFASKMIELGARGYLTKTSSLEEIHEGIRIVQEGEFYICDEIKNHMEFVPPKR